MKRPEINNVEVDMVPLIDIISLLLMFLIIVGDSAASASSINMKLPRASEAKTEKELKLNTEGRIVIQMRKGTDGKYQAVINNKNYETGVESGISLKDYLDKQIDYAIQKKLANKKPDGTLDWAVKLRIPEDCPMQEVEKVVSTMAAVGLVMVHYAADATKAR